MGFFKRLFGREETTSSCNLVVSSVEALRMSSSPKEDVTSDRMAMSLSTVHRCVSLICDSVASIPFRYKYIKDGIFKDFETSPLHYLLSVQPMEDMSIYDFKFQLVQQMLIGNGNAYVYPRMVDERVTELVLLSPGSCAHNPMTKQYVVSDVWNGVSGTFSEGEILHFFINSLDGKTGVSTLEFAKRTMNISATGDRETLDRFANGGNVMGFITNDKTVTGFGEYQDEQLINTAQSLENLFRNGARIASLPGQTDFKQISLSSTDMQFLESRKFEVRQICRFFGVNPSFVFDDTASNYKSAEMAQAAFRATTLNPILCKIEGEFTRKMIPRTLCGKRKFQFDRKALYACDLETLVNYQQKTIQAGLYSVNDWRKYEDQPGVEGGDRVLVSTNLAPIDSKKLSGE